jgi:hypothetical protein
VIDKIYADFAWEQTAALLAIDSPKVPQVRLCQRGFIFLQMVMQGMPGEACLCMVRFSC